MAKNIDTNVMLWWRLPKSTPLLIYRQLKTSVGNSRVFSLFATCHNTNSGSKLSIQEIDQLGELLIFIYT